MVEGHRGRLRIQGGQAPLTAGFSRRPLGHGVGLRQPHYAHLLEHGPGEVGWFEATPENFFGPGGRPWAVMSRVRREVPVALHGVALGIGNSDPLSTDYLARLADVIARVEPAWVSDHLCWSAHGGRYAHDLWPLPYTDESLAHVAARLHVVQETLGRSVLLENVSRYVAFADDELEEPEFLNELARRTGCGILLDVNNAYVTAHNLGGNGEAYIDAIDADAVGEIHLAGHVDEGDFMIDTHSAHVADAVWDLYRRAVRRIGPVPTLVEWDEDLPAFDVLVEEARRAGSVEREVLAHDSP